MAGLRTRESEERSRQGYPQEIERHPGWILVGEAKNRIVASVMVGYEGHRGWINYLAVAPDLRKQGLGRKILEHAEKKLSRLGCPKINLQVREGNESVLGFYRAMGYQEDAVVSLGKRLIDDSSAGKRTRRTRP
jgi:ribosomal protein S18 acetylase RimI-like enzyme